MGWFGFLMLLFFASIVANCEENSSQTSRYSLVVRHFLDSLHKRDSEGNIVVDGHFLGFNVMLYQGIIYAKSHPFYINGNNEHNISLHLESHAISWVGWKNVAPPIRIRIVDEFPVPCSKSVSQIVMMFGIGAFPMYGHVLFNTQSCLFYTMKQLGQKPFRVFIVIYSCLKLIRLIFLILSLLLLLIVHSMSIWVTLGIPIKAPYFYAALDSSDRRGTKRWPGSSKDIFSPFKVLSADSSIHAFEHLNRVSHYYALCFSQLSVGLLGGLDHYNFSSPPHEWEEYRESMASLFNISSMSTQQDSLENPTHCHIIFLTRKNNRRILNLAQLVNILHNYSCFIDLFQAESMTFQQQMRRFRNATMLIGVDGSGLLNAAFLRSCTSVLRIMPWGCSNASIANLAGKGNNFKQLALKTAGHWMSLDVPHRNLTHFPLGLIKSLRLPGEVKELHDLLQQTPEGQEATLQLSSRFSHNIILSYFLNQDSIIPTDIFRRYVEEGLEYRRHCLSNSHRSM